MKKLFFLVALAALLMPVLAMAQSAFDGTWKVNMNKVEFPKKPDMFLLQNGMYDCKTCTPPWPSGAMGKFNMKYASGRCGRAAESRLAGTVAQVLLPCCQTSRPRRPLLREVSDSRAA